MTRATLTILAMTGRRRVGLVRRRAAQDPKEKEIGTSVADATPSADWVLVAENSGESQ